LDFGLPFANQAEVMPDAVESIQPYVTSGSIGQKMDVWVAISGQRSAVAVSRQPSAVSRQLTFEYTWRLKS
jgi:hypothetical protein